MKKSFSIFVIVFASTTMAVPRQRDVEDVQNVQMLDQISQETRTNTLETDCDNKLTKSDDEVNN